MNNHKNKRLIISFNKNKLKSHNEYIKDIDNLIECFKDKYSYWGANKWVLFIALAGVLWSLISLVTNKYPKYISKNDIIFIFRLLNYLITYILIIVVFVNLIARKSKNFFTFIRLGDDFFFRKGWVYESCFIFIILPIAVYALLTREWFIMWSLIYKTILGVIIYKYSKNNKKIYYISDIVKYGSWRMYWLRITRKNYMFYASIPIYLLFPAMLIDNIPLIKVINVNPDILKIPILYLVFCFILMYYLYIMNIASSIDALKQLKLSISLNNISKHDIRIQLTRFVNTTVSVELMALQIRITMLLERSKIYSTLSYVDNVEKYKFLETFKSDLNTVANYLAINDDYFTEVEYIVVRKLMIRVKDAKKKLKDFNVD